MSANSTIEWCEASWSPTTGCDRVSAGCDHCYAMTLAKRLKGMGSAKYQNDGDPATSGPGFGITEHPDALTIPLRWRKPRRIFVDSMSDLFHAGVSDEFIARVWAVMAACPQHTFQILTKRHGRMRSLLNSPRWPGLVFDAVRALPDIVGGAPLRHYDAARVWAESPELAGELPAPLPGVWLGVSVEDQKAADLRIPALLDTPATVRFLSCEPMIGSVDLGRWTVPDGTGTRPCIPDLSWAICGGESGKGARPMDPEWARQLRDQCVTARVPYFFKQWGGITPKAGGRELDGRTWDEYPTDGAVSDG